MHWKKHKLQLKKNDKNKSQSEIYCKKKMWIYIISRYFYLCKYTSNTYLIRLEKEDDKLRQQRGKIKKTFQKNK